MVRKSNPDLAQAGRQPVRLRFELREADLFSMRFVEKPQGGPENR